MTGGGTISRVARKGHPFLSAAVGAAVLTFTLLSFANAHAAAATGYRLTGIVAVGQDYLGFLEMPGGVQVLVRKGSVIEGGGRILLLDAQRLRIGLPSGVIELSLEGSGRPAAVPVPAAAVGGGELPPDGEYTLFRAVEPKRLGEARGAAAKADAPRSTASIATALRLGPILNLPPNSRVVAVNDQPVTSVDAAIAGIERALASNIMATLNLAGSNGGPDTRVYVSRAGN